jgi:periplasmic protein TonB
MSAATTSVPDVFTAQEVARAAGVRPDRVRRLILAGRVATIDGRYIALPEAVRAVAMAQSQDIGAEPGLFHRAPAVQRGSGRALMVSGALHVAMLAAIAALTSLTVGTEPQKAAEAMRLVFLAAPGPGGGGGGGGLRQPEPPPRAELQGPALQKSPVPPAAIVRRPDPRAGRVPPPSRREPVDQQVAPPAPPPPPVPRVTAPVATAAADAHDKAGTAGEEARDRDSHGTGAGGGAGTGTGSGIGQGEGAGIGEGAGGGTGGGPYRAGSGITPPSVQREVKPDYTEQARRRGIAGDVVLEIVVRSNGSVGDVRVLQGLGSGLDERAVEAVRQWRFSPARRLGTPVDVLVEVAVEFKLR